MSVHAILPCGGWLVQDWENPSGGHTLHRWFKRCGGPLGDCLVRSIRRCAPDPRLRVWTSKLPSGLQEPFKALAYLLMGQRLAALERFLAKPHRVNKAAFLVEIPGPNSSGLRPCRAADWASLASCSGVKCTSMRPRVREKTTYGKVARRMKVAKVQAIPADTGMAAFEDWTQLPDLDSILMP
jgi:hypothetical protein